MKFDTEQLFHSPTNAHATHRRHSAGDVSVLLQEQSTARYTSSSGGNSSSGTGGGDVETIDDAPSRSHLNTSVLNTTADYSLNNISMVSDHPGINTSAYGHTHTPYTTYPPSGVYRGSGGTSSVNNTSHVSGVYTSSVDISSVNINDGGYYEGYWRAKYIRSSKQ